jgi:hypothetical protein
MESGVGVETLGLLPKGSLSLVERNRFVSRPAERAGLVRLARQRHVELVNDMFPPNENVAKQGLCGRCEHRFVLSRSDQLYCSDDCKNAVNQATHRKAESKPFGGPVTDAPSTPEKAYGEGALTSTFASTFVTEGVCEYCGHPFVARTGGRPARFCSNRCKQRHYRYRRPVEVDG